MPMTKPFFTPAMLDRVANFLFTEDGGRSVILHLESGGAAEINALVQSPAGTIEGLRLSVAGSVLVSVAPEAIIGVEFVTRFAEVDGDSATETDGPEPGSVVIADADESAAEIRASGRRGGRAKTV